MNIIRKDEQTLLIDAGDQVVVFTLADNHKPDDDKLVFGPKLDNPHSLPGEYEYTGSIEVVIVETRRDKIGQGQLFMIAIEGIRIAFATADVNKINKEYNELLGEIDVLFVSDGLGKEMYNSLVNALDVKQVVGLDILDNSTLNKLTDKQVKGESKLKYKLDHFAGNAPEGLEVICLQK